MESGCEGLFLLMHPLPFYQPELKKKLPIRMNPVFNPELPAFPSVTRRSVVDVSWSGSGFLQKGVDASGNILRRHVFILISNFVGKREKKFWISINCVYEILKGALGKTPPLERQ